MTTGGSSLSGRDIIIIVVAVVILLIFVGFAIYVLGLTDTQEPQWSRAVYVLGGIEAIAFAAAGFLFGTEVNRRRAENAEERVTGAENRANAAQDGARKGEALAAQVIAKNEAWQGDKGESVYGGLGDEEAETATKTTQAELDELAKVAKTLFPESES